MPAAMYGVYREVGPPVSMLEGSGGHLRRCGNASTAGRVLHPRRDGYFFAFAGAAGAPVLAFAWVFL